MRSLEVGGARRILQDVNGRENGDYGSCVRRRCGVPLRRLPDQPSLKQVRIAHEITEFTYVVNASTYPLVLDGDQSSWEDEYQRMERERAGILTGYIGHSRFMRTSRQSGGVEITPRPTSTIIRECTLVKAARYASRTLHADLSPHADRSETIHLGYASEDNDAETKVRGAC